MKYEGREQCSRPWPDSGNLVPPRPQSWNACCAANQLCILDAATLQLVHVGEELGVVADLLKAADEELHGFDG